jgi:hypothetical protein
LRARETFGAVVDVVALDFTIELFVILVAIVSPPSRPPELSHSPVATHRLWMQPPTRASSSTIGNADETPR